MSPTLHERLAQHTHHRLHPSVAWRRNRDPRRGEHRDAEPLMLVAVALNARQVGILTMVTELEPMTQKSLADALRIDRTTMVALLDDLEDKGYVARQRHPRDRRAFLVQPTDSGRAAKVAAVRILDEQQRRFLAPLTPAESAQLSALLKRLNGQSPPAP